MQISVNDQSIVTQLLRDRERDMQTCQSLSNLLQDKVDVLRFVVEQEQYKTLRTTGDFRKEIDSEYWRRLASATPLLNRLPTAQRERWNEAIETRTTPEFTLDAIAGTAQDIYENRSQHMVDLALEVWDKIKPRHKTNEAKGFGLRFIISGYQLHYWHGNAGFDALRRLINLVLLQPHDGDISTSQLMQYLVEFLPGEWVYFDGASMKVKACKNGNIHVQIHPSLASQLNELLAQGMPLALPRETKAGKNWKPMEALEGLRLSDQNRIALLSLGVQSDDAGWYICHRGFERDDPALTVLFERLGVNWDGNRPRMASDVSYELRLAGLSGIVERR